MMSDEFPALPPPELPMKGDAGPGVSDAQESTVGKTGGTATPTQRKGDNGVALRLDSGLGEGGEEIVVDPTEDADATSPVHGNVGNDTLELDGVLRAAEKLKISGGNDKVDDTVDLTSSPDNDVRERVLGNHHPYVGQVPLEQTRSDSNKARRGAAQKSSVPSAAEEHSRVSLVQEGDMMGFSAANKSPMIKESPTFFRDPRCSLVLPAGEWRTKELSTTCSFDVLGKCLSCDVDHLVFGDDPVVDGISVKKPLDRDVETNSVNQVTRGGVLIIGDEYVPPLIGSDGKCIAVLRMYHAHPNDVRSKLRFLFGPKSGPGKESLKTRPSFILVSLMGHLMEVGARDYAENMFNLMCWIRSFIHNEVENAPDNKIWRGYFEPCSCQCYEVFFPFTVGSPGGFLRDINDLLRSQEIRRAGSPTSPNFANIHNPLLSTFKHFSKTAPPTMSDVGYLQLRPSKGVMCKVVPYIQRQVYPGIAKSHSKDGSVAGEVEEFFVNALVREITKLLTDSGYSLTSAHLPDPDHVREGLKSPAQRVGSGRTVTYAAASPGNKVVIYGNSQMKALSLALKESYNLSFQYVKSEMTHFSEPELVLEALVDLGVQEGDTVVLGHLGNYLLQGRVKKSEFSPTVPSGLPALHTMVNRIHHLTNVAEYDPSWFDCVMTKLFHVIDGLRSIKVKVVMICPFPRYSSKCCEEPTHFPSIYSGGTLGAEILRLGVYMSRHASMSGCVVVHPQDLAKVEHWGTGSVMVGPDQIHLTSGGVKKLSKRVCSILTDPPTPADSAPINPDFDPITVPFSEWVEGFRGGCGYTSVDPPPRATGVSVKRPAIGSAGNASGKRKR